jgi:hypothetical protein
LAEKLGEIGRTLLSSSAVAALISVYMTKQNGRAPSKDVYCDDDSSIMMFSIYAFSINLLCIISALVLYFGYGFRLGI